MNKANSASQKEIIVPSIEALPQAAKELLTWLNGRKKIGLSGEIGAGKTTFTQAFCRELGITDAVQSPTYSLVNEHQFTNNNGKEEILYHLDLYRLNSVEEAIDIGLEDYLYSDNYCLVEWVEIAEPLLPADMVRIKIEIMPDSSRKMVVL